MKACGVAWGCAARALAGESESGDLDVVAPFDGGVLMAVIDGLGHGPDAALAARAAAEVLSASPALAPLTLVERCHAALRGTRGAALLIVSIASATGESQWIGVGNVEGVRFRREAGFGVRREALISRPGVVGYQLGALKQYQSELATNDTFILATDGVAPRFVEDGVGNPDESPEAIAWRILTRHGRSSDDALVLVARYEGIPG
jgi:phosphoserine phosphatase RsbX